MTKSIRWGILSTANIGRAKVIPAIQNARNGQVVAVASRSLTKAQTFARALNIPTAYGSYEELIAAPDIDAIYNPLPNSEHAAWSIRCAEAGKPVLCEKPLARDAAEAQSIVDAFAARGILFAEAFMYRFHPQTRKVLALLAEGAVGAVQVIQAAFTFVISDENNIRLSKALAGGALMDVGCYCINVMRLITGEEPDRAQAAARFGAASRVDEQLAGVLEFPSGVLGHFDCGLRTYRTHGYEIRGTAGRIRVDVGFTMPANAKTTINYWGADQRHRKIKVGRADHYRLMVEDFAAALLEGRPPRFLPQDAVQNMQVIDQLLASARAEGRR